MKSPVVFLYYLLNFRRWNEIFVSDDHFPPLLVILAFQQDTILSIIYPILLSIVLFVDASNTCQLCGMSNIFSVVLS